MTRDNSDNLYVTGYFSGTADFDPGAGNDNRIDTDGDNYLTKFDTNGAYLWVKTWGGGGFSYPSSITAHTSGDMYITGAFGRTVDFDPGAGVDYRTVSNANAFLIKYDLAPGSRNGSCGFSNGISFPTVPSTNLCNVGLQSSVTGNGPWSWTCSGVNGGTDEACSANYESGNEGGGIDPTYFFNRFNTQLDINATVALSCENSVIMQPIVGTGKSTIALSGGKATNNVAQCNVKTNSSSGFVLQWNASSTIQASGAMKNVTNDTISPYSLTASSETWSIANTTSEWGAKLGASSEGYGTGNGGGDYSYTSAGGWGADDGYTDGKWMNVPMTAFQIMQKSTETDADGEYQYLVFGAEIGHDKIQPTGTYTQEVTVTALTVDGSGGGGGGEVVEGVDGNGCSWFSMAYGETKNRTLDSGDCQTNPANDYAEYAKFTATAGDFIRVVLDYENDYNYLVLTDDSDTVIRSNWGFSEDSVINYTIPTSGTYRLWAASYYPSLPVSYTLTLDDTESYAQNNGYGIKVTVPVFGSGTPAVNYRVPQPGRWLTIFEVPYGLYTDGHPRETLARWSQLEDTYYSEGIYPPPAFPLSVHSKTITDSDVISNMLWGAQFHQNFAWYHTKVHFVWDDPTKNVDVFVFTDAVEQPTNTLVTSPSIPVTGVAGSYSVSVSGNGSPQIEINGSDNWITGGTINVGDRIRVRLTSSSSADTTNTAQIVIGDMTGTWNVTSAPSGFALNPFSFSDQTGVALGLTIDSNEANLSGFSGPQTAVCGSGCVEIARNGVWSGSTMVEGFMPDDDISIRQVASANNSVTTTATVTVGPTTSATWSVTTLQDTTPDSFSFNDLTGQSISTLVTSDPVTINGFSGTLTASIAGNGTPRIEINNSGTWVSSASITPGQSVRARLTTPAAGLASTLITVGNTSDVWTVATTVNCTNIGDVCWDGTIRAGVTPDGSVTMYSARCDAGQTWTGAACTGTASTLQWASASSTTGFTSVITGENNTSGLSALGAGFAAARYCDQLNQDGNNDWYLPARDELAVLRTNRAAIGNFSGSGSVYYWSSTELSSTNASGRIFSTGTLTISAKTTSGNSRIRCVRK